MQSKHRLIRRVSVTDMDTVKTRQKRVGRERDVQLLERCQTLWNNLSEFRERRARVTRFTYGDQWGDLITVNGETMTMRKYLMDTGNVVLQTNQIKSKVDTIVGVLLKEQNEPLCSAHDPNEQQYGEVLTAGLQANCNKNKMEALYTLWTKDMCTGGMAIAHESYDAHGGPDNRMDSWTSYVNTNQVFFDSAMSDPRFWDLTIIGQFFEMSFEQVTAKFARNEKDYAILKAIYPDQSVVFRNDTLDDITEKRSNDRTEFMSGDVSKCYVLEVWTKESKPRIRLNDLQRGTEEIIDADDYPYRRSIRETNARRRSAGLAAGWPEEDIPYIIGDGYGRDEEERNGFFEDTYWYCRYLAPDGTILWEGESPYPDRAHPFSICATPMADGKIVGYCSDMVDHNMAINRAYILNDWLLRAQSKGVVVVPKKIVPKDMKLKEFARRWTSIDDMMFIEMEEGQEKLMPQVFHGPAQTFDVSRLVESISRMMENSSAVSAAIQGKTPYSGTSGSLYAQMTNNASTPIAALLTQLHIFMEDIHTKKLKNLVLFYDEKRWTDIAGSIDGIFDNANLNLNEIGNIEYDLKIKESAAAPVYRALANETLDKLLGIGAISPLQYLKYGYRPGMEGLRQEMEAREAEVEAAQNGEVPGVAPEEAVPSAGPTAENIMSPPPPAHPVGKIGITPEIK